MSAREMTLVVRGVYDSYTVLAVADDDDAAERWANDWNNSHRELIHGPDDWARAGDKVPYVGGGR